MVKSKAAAAKSAKPKSKSKAKGKSRKQKAKSAPDPHAADEAEPAKKKTKITSKKHIDTSLILSLAHDRKFRELAEYAQWAVARLDEMDEPEGCYYIIAPTLL